MKKSYQLEANWAGTNPTPISVREANMPRMRAVLVPGGRWILFSSIDPPVRVFYRDLDAAEADDWPLVDIKLENMVGPTLPITISDVESERAFSVNIVIPIESSGKRSPSSLMNKSLTGSLSP